MLTDRNITSRSRLGFIGLGYLGSRIARRLTAAGFPMLVYDRNRKRAKELAALGAEVAPNPEQLAGNVDVVLSCLRRPPGSYTTRRGGLTFRYSM